MEAKARELDTKVEANERSIEELRKQSEVNLNKTITSINQIQAFSDETKEAVTTLKNEVEEIRADLNMVFQPQN